MNLIEQLEKLLVNDYGRVYELRKDLRTIIEQAKREAVEPVAVPSSVMRDALMRSVDVVAPTPQPELARCKSCNGNDYDMPCAYPSEGKHGCLRDARLAPQPDHNKLIGELVEALEKAEKCLVNSCMSHRNKVYPKPVDRVRVANYCNRAITKARRRLNDIH